MLMERIPEWLICEDVDGDRTFVFHTFDPKFVCEVYDEDEAEWDAANATYEMADGRLLGNFVWYGEVDEHKVDIETLSAHAAEALEIYEDNLENEYGNEGL